MYSAIFYPHVTKSLFQRRPGSLLGFRSCAFQRGNGRARSLLLRIQSFETKSHSFGRPGGKRGQGFVSFFCACCSKRDDSGTSAFLTIHLKWGHRQTREHSSEICHSRVTQFFLLLLGRNHVRDGGQAVFTH